MPTVKFDGGGIIIWVAMSYSGTGNPTKAIGNMSGHRYIESYTNKAVLSAHYLWYVDNICIQDKMMEHQTT